MGQRPAHILPYGSKVELGLSGCIGFGNSDLGIGVGKWYLGRGFGSFARVFGVVVAADIVVGELELVEDVVFALVAPDVVPAVVVVVDVVAAVRPLFELLFLPLFPVSWPF